MIKRYLLCALLVGASPATVIAGATSSIPDSCAGRKQEERCRGDVVAELEQVAAFMGSPQARETIALLNPRHGVAQLCHMGSALFKRTEKDAAVLWHYLRARHTQWTPRMKKVIESAAIKQTEKILNREQLEAFQRERLKNPRTKMPSPIKVDALRAFRFVSERLPGSSEKTRCTWKTEWFGWLASSSAKALQKEVPLVASDIARMLARDVKDDVRNVSIGLVYLHIFDELRR